MKSHFKDSSEHQFISSKERGIYFYEKKNQEIHGIVDPSMYLPNIVTHLQWNHKNDSYITSIVGSDYYSRIYEWTKSSGKTIYSLYNKTIFTFDFTFDFRKMSIGGSKSSFLFDIETKKQILMFSKSEDVLSQQILSDHLVLNGDRSGDIKMYDIRSRKLTNFKAKTKYPVISMKFLKNEFHLVTSSMEGNLFLFDLRFEKKPLLKYEEHKNKSSLLKFTTDDEEEFIFSPGDDHLVRVFDINTGQVNHSIGPFEESITDIIFDKEYMIFGSTNNVYFYG